MRHPVYGSTTLLEVGLLSRTSDVAVPVGRADDVHIARSSHRRSRTEPGRRKFAGTKSSRLHTLSALSRKNPLLPALPARASGAAVATTSRLGRCTCQLPLISRSIDNAASDERQCVQIHLHASHRPQGLQRRVVPSLQSLKSSPAR